MWPLLLLHFAELAFFHMLKPTLEVLFAVSMQITLPELRRPWEYAPQDRLGTMFNLRRKSVRQRGKEEKILQTTVDFRPVSFCSRICNVTGYLLCLRPLRGKSYSNNDSVIVSNPQKKKQCRSNCCGGGQHFHTVIINPDFPDLDNDGISDSSDLCNGTIPSQSVNEQGCALYQLDTDNDGVDDSLDLCSGTTTDLTVNANGCNLTQLDSDGDGLSDALDTCPGTLPQSNINMEGCSEEQIGVSDIDSDQDGVIDSEDNCPETDIGESVDENGCTVDEIPDYDTDGDGVIDSEDNCPETVTGDSVDVNGCAIDDVPDYDTDGDGIKDFMDLCQSTPIGSEVDIYGCLINQVDINDANASSNNEFQSYIIIAVSIILCTLFVALIKRNNASEILPIPNGDFSKASSLQSKLNNTINDNLKLRDDRQLLQKQLRNKDLTESENIKLRNELISMQSMTDNNVSEMERMAFELQELRSIIENTNQTNIKNSEN